MVDPNLIDFSLMLSWTDSNSDFTSKAVRTSSGLVASLNHVQETSKRQCKSGFSMNVGSYLPAAIPPTDHALTTSSCGRWPMDGSPDSYFSK